MKKWMAWIFVPCLLAGLTACGRQAGQPVAGAGGNVFRESVEENVEENLQPSGNVETGTQVVRETDQGQILIAYFSWADNTAVQDEAAAVQSALSHYESIGDRENYSDADAIASASVVAPGNTAKLAQWIQEYAGGELFPIVVTEFYPDNYDECLERAADEKADNARPKLAGHLDNPDGYDVIFLGFPNWWYTAPMAVFSFIEEYDLSGKTIIPFCVHGTGGIAGSVRDITAALPDSANILEPLGVYRADINRTQPVVKEWLEKLGFQETGWGETGGKHVQGRDGRMDKRAGAGYKGGVENISTAITSVLYRSHFAK